MPLQKWSDEIWVSQLADDPAFSEDFETLIPRYTKAEPRPHLVIDLSGVRILNSSNLSQILRVRKLAADAGRGLRIAGPNDAVWSVFLTTGLDKVFGFSEDTTTALAQLQLGDG
ncbi:MAG: STAS domain-containing protein [Planctomycetota bacterium]